MNVMYMMQQIMNQANKIAGSFQNPQMMIQQFFPDAPQEVRNDPNAIIQWLQQTGRVTPEMMQTAQRMMGGK